MIGVTASDRGHRLRITHTFVLQNSQISERFFTEDVTKRKRTNPKDVRRKEKREYCFFGNGQVGYL